MVILKEKILFIIVSYRQKYWETTSYKTLVNSYKSNNDKSDLHIFIADNTDEVLWDCSDYVADEGIKIKYEKYNNLGLSYAYNRGVEYAKRNGFSWIVLLDQDSDLPKDIYTKYYESLENQNVYIKVPITFINNMKILSPSKYIYYRSFLYDKINSGIMNIENHSFINTGMLIKVDFYLDVGGYNEFIKLDFTDHDFVYRAKNNTDKFEVLDIKINQDFSSVTHSKKQAIERYSLYLRDLKEFKKGKSNQIMLFINADLLRVVKLSVKYKTLEFIKIRLEKW